MFNIKIILGSLLVLLSQQVAAFDELQNILLEDKKPEGVVIEITSFDRLYLEKIFEELKSDISALRNKFKDIPVAIVSHASESLLLASKEQDKHPALHKSIKSLSTSGDTSIHVCGTYASWYNVSEDDFPDYINVSPAGPVQVDDYIELGYIHIEL